MPKPCGFDSASKAQAACNSALHFASSHITSSKAGKAGSHRHDISAPRGTQVKQKLLPLVFEDLLLGAEPVMFVLAGFTTTAFVQLIGPLSYHVL